MEQEKCGCHDAGEEEGCAGCSAQQIFAYWCEHCQRSVPEKRCPYCGLKARKKRETGPPQP